MKSNENGLPAIRPIDYWWNTIAGTIDIVEIDGKLYALSGWNGEQYLDCWECVDRYTAHPDGRIYCICPTYRYEAEEIDLDDLIQRDLENSPEWDHALEVVRYIVK